MISSVDMLKINLECAMFNKINESCNQNSNETSVASFSDFLNDAVSASDISSVSESSSVLPLNSVSSQDTVEAGSMKASDSLVKFIENHEGFSSTTYNSLDYWNDTIGYGHVVKSGENLTSLDKESAETLLKNDLKTYEASVNKEFKGTKLTQSQFDSLVSFSYGLGAYVWDKTPKLVSDIKNGASNETLKTDFENCAHCNGELYEGLVNRKDDEWNMFANGVYNRI